MNDENEYVYFHLGPKKKRLTMSPNRNLGNAFVEALKEFGLPSNIADYNLVYEHDGKPVKDFESIWKNLRFPSNANFKIIKLANSGATGGADVKIALDTKTGRLIQSFSSSTTLWGVLRYFETNEVGKGIEITRRGAVNPSDNGQDVVYMQPCLLYKPYQKEIDNNADLRRTTLADIGLLKGNGAISLSFRYTIVKLDDYLRADEEDQKKCESELEQSLVQEQKNIELMKEARKDENYYDAVRKEQEEDDNERDRRLNYDKKWDITQRLLRMELEKLQVGKESSIEEARVNEVHDEPAQNVIPNRDIKILFPSQIPLQDEVVLPDSFYEPTRDDVKVTKSIIVNGVLQSFQQKDEEKYQPSSTCLIRVRFPDRVDLQVKFAAFETPKSLYNIVRENLKGDIANWYLFTMPSNVRLQEDSEDSFLQLNFLPKCLVYFGTLDGISESKNILKEETFTNYS